MVEQFGRGDRRLILVIKEVRSPKVRIECCSKVLQLQIQLLADQPLVGPAVHAFRSGAMGPRVARSP